MKAKLILMAIALFTSVNLFAQEDNDNKKTKREELEAQKVAFITTQLDLTTDEAKDFWPLYNEREKEMREVRKKIREQVKEGKTMDEMTDDEVKKMMEEVIKLKKEELEIEEKYNTKFQTVLPVKKVAKLHMAERKFNEEVLRAWKEKKHEGKPHKKPGDR